jgi:O-6-methylguanine DNA methyltransferase
MSESTLHTYGAATRADVSPDFTAKVFAGCGLDRYVVAVSAAGEVYLAWNATGVSAIRLTGDEEAFEAWYRARFDRGCVPAIEDDPTSLAARAKLRGEDVEVPVDLRGCSPFEQRVLEKTSEIARGSARPYRWVAREIGAPGAMRSVGSALGRNPVPLLIPCHRVIRTDCSPGGYGLGGTAVKRTLLEGEGMDLEALETLAHRGIRYIGCDDGTFCLPTCGDVATRVSAPGYVGLHNLDEAHAHGLVPCSQCRPIAA